MKKGTVIGIIVVLIVIIFIVLKSSKSSSYTPVNSQPSTNQPLVPVVPVQTPTASTSMATSSSATAKGTIGLSTATNKSLGAYIVAANGMTLYKYSKDTPGVSNCSGSCIAAWPPYTVSTSSLIVGKGINGSLSTITRASGTMQLTYKGLPLYFWQGDSKAGDTTGQKINGFSVVKP